MVLSLEARQGKANAYLHITFGYIERSDSQVGKSTGQDTTTHALEIVTIGMRNGVRISKKSKTRR